MKPVVWLGTSKADLKAFPATAMDDMGHQLFRVQCGLDPGDWKPMAIESDTDKYLYIFVMANLVKDNEEAVWDYDDDAFDDDELQTEQPAEVAEDVAVEQPATEVATDGEGGAEGDGAEEEIVEVEDESF